MVLKKLIERLLVFPQDSEVEFRDDELVLKVKGEGSLISVPCPDACYTIKQD